MYKTIRTISLYAVILIGLIGCGFHLVGSDIHLPFKRIYLSTKQPFSLLSQELTYQLHQLHVTVVKSTEQSQLVLAILSDEDTVTTLSTGGNGQISRETIHKTVTYQLQDRKGRRIGDINQVSAQQYVAISQDQMLSGDNSINKVKREVAKKCSQELLRQLASSNVSQALKKHAKLYYKNPS